jgi:glyoxylase-like metal-dependent hydrolase (beta-lactamase superfamily II)
MRLSESLYVVGGGANGLGISETYDSAVYLLASGSQLVLIDAGCGIDPAPVLANVEDAGRNPSQISHVLLTHCHADHAGAAAFWREHTGAGIAASEEEAPLLEAAAEEQLGLVRARADGSYPSDYRLRPCPIDVRLRHGEAIGVGNLSFTPIHVPGHSRGSICYLAEIDGRRCLFSGDVVFCGGWISLLNCPGSSLADYGAHITRLSNLDVDALLPGHFGFTLGMGQSHIDRAVAELRGLWPPRHLV